MKTEDIGTAHRNAARFRIITETLVIVRHLPAGTEGRPDGGQVVDLELQVHAGSTDFASPVFREFIPEDDIADLQECGTANRDVAVTRL